MLSTTADASRILNVGCLMVLHDQEISLAFSANNSAVSSTVFYVVKEACLNDHRLETERLLFPAYCVFHQSDQ